ncbi:MAG: polyprenyl synthetase family protein [Endomicrobiales bacterium]|nr:polyprenyl synthetase family protein [Endomicrobiales bacterium]
MELSAWLQKNTRIINRALERYCSGKGALIKKAMRYSIFAGGKRLRPVLVMEAARLCDMNPEKVIPAACAAEFIHTYSLIHDDLPAMDDDDLRRGRPTSHRKFGEAAAILAGDALLTDAFRILSDCSFRNGIDPKRTLKAGSILAAGAGSEGMVEGQMKDTVESGKWNSRNRKAAARDLKHIHERKTGALIRSCLKMGAVLAGAGNAKVRALDSYGRNIGLAFQIADDVLDIEGNKKLLGKRGSDADNRKLTFPAVYGLGESKRMAAGLVRKAKSSLKVFGKKAQMLDKLADYVIERKH